MQLHNKVEGRVLKERIQFDETERSTISFYKYYHIKEPHELRDELYQKLDHIHVMGRIYVSYEGVNAQVSVPDEQLQEFQNVINSISFLNGIRLNFAVEDDPKSFFKLAIKVRNKIVADGLNDSEFDVTKHGKHLDAEEFNQLASDPNTIIVDMRNHYESEIGHFVNAYTPDVETFREALKVVETELEDKKDKNIVMYCTGGIRCEKASAYYKHRGFQNVYQLNGGIINYARQVEEKGLENKFIGKNFVFDERLGERISNDIVSKCHQCGKTCDNHTNCKNVACNVLFIQCDECKEKYGNCCSNTCQDFIDLPEDYQKEWRRKVSASSKRYSKGRIKPRPEFEEALRQYQKS